MANKQLILLRHAKSDWHSEAQSDHARPLNHRGQRDAPKVGRWLSEQGYQPQRIICSTANRATETLQLAYDAAGWGKLDIDFDEALYLASESTIVDLIIDNLRDCERLMMVGHNPGMDSVLLSYCPDVMATLRNKLGHKLGYKLMTTATVAIIEFNCQSSGAALSDAVLLEFQRPTEIE